MKSYLSKLNIWALSFGCAVGWGAFVMPATTFLPIAGPLGTVIGLSIGTIIMMIIGVNYCYLMNHYPDSNGTLTYTVKVFGYDHGFISAWFMMLVYIGIIWANVTALTIMMRYLLGSTLQFGFHYVVFGYDVYLGEVLLSVATVIISGAVVIYKRAAALIQTVMALALFIGVIICFNAIIHNADNTGSISQILFARSSGDNAGFGKIMHIIFLSPWAFVGFESVSLYTKEFRFPIKKTIWIITASLITAGVSYIVLSLLIVALMPKYAANWNEYLHTIELLSGFDGFPVFHVMHILMDKLGLFIIIVMVLCAIFTGVIGNYIAASRLLAAMAEENILPEWFGKTDKNDVPRNAIFFLMIISCVIPLMGRSAIGWIVDVNTVGATFAFGYTSAAAFVVGRKNNSRFMEIMGAVGTVLSVGFFLIFIVISADALATESYLILVVWCILGFAFFRHVFSIDNDRRFGKSINVWGAMLVFIFFISLVWIRQTNDDMTRNAISNIGHYYEQLSDGRDDTVMSESKDFVAKQIKETNRMHTRNSFIQIVFVLIALGYMMSIYRTISLRARRWEIAKIHAEESNKAKSRFLSNMSHDIRSPMNAILGYAHLMRNIPGTSPKILEYLGKIDASGQQLLAIINDVLEMSRIESGKFELQSEPVNLCEVVHDVFDIFRVQMAEKRIAYTIDVSAVTDQNVILDKNHFSRVLMNLISNAYKFTPEGGNVAVRVSQSIPEQNAEAEYEFRVKDNGIGMSKEFSKNVFETFEREKTSTVSGIQGTGLGMAISKSIIDVMGGTIIIDSAPGVGTEFRILVRLPITKEEISHESKKSDPENVITDYAGKRVLLVDDIEVNREIAQMILESAGFIVETAENGQDAVDKVAHSGAGYYDLILMDIQMPVMNGYEATQAIRAMDDKTLANLPIIALTANAFKEDEQNALEAGMNAHVSKPLDVDKLLVVINKLLSAK